MFKGVIISVKILKPTYPIKIPSIRPLITITIPSREIILNILFLEYPIARNTAKSPILFSRLLANPEKILKTAIEINIVESIPKLFDPNPSIDVRRVISKEGWPNIHFLYHRFGFQPELIHAAGMCHQHGARDWLIKLLNEQEEFQLKILQALACWGAYLPQALIQKTLSQPEQAMQLATYH